MFLFILFIFVAPLVCGAVAIFNTVDSATEAVRGGIEDGLKSVPATPAEPAVAPKGIAGRSLVRKANFAAALAKLRGSELRLTHLRLAPERIDAQLLTRAGNLRSMQVQPGGVDQAARPRLRSGLRPDEHDPVRAPERRAHRSGSPAAARPSSASRSRPCSTWCRPSSAARSGGPRTSSAAATCSATPPGATSAAIPS